MNAEKKFHYVDVSSGRYFCAEHGGFCDERDGFQKECLVCGEAKAIICINRTQRMLKLINGLQERSKRSVGLLSAIVGGVGVLTLLKKLPDVGASHLSEPLSSTRLNLWPESLTEVLLILAVCLFSLAIALYASSMAQVPVVEDRKIETRTQIEWEGYLLSFLGGMEGRHKWGSRSFVLGLNSLTAIPILSLIQYIFRCLSP